MVGRQESKEDGTGVEFFLLTEHIMLKLWNSSLRDLLACILAEKRLFLYCLLGPCFSVEYFDTLILFVDCQCD